MWATLKTQTDDYENHSKLNYDDASLTDMLHILKSRLIT